MNGDAAGFTGSIPQHYDRSLGPLIFADYAADISHRVAACSPARVLETAAGTGIVTRWLRDVLPAGVRLTATDLNPPMLEIARTKFRPGEQVDFQPADATALPFADSSFDAVVCQFGVMFFPDKDKSSRGSSRPCPWPPLSVQHLGFASPQPVRQDRARSRGKLFFCRSASVPECAVLLSLRSDQRVHDRRRIHRHQRCRSQVGEGGPGPREFSLAGWSMAARSSIKSGNAAASRPNVLSMRLCGNIAVNSAPIRDACPFKQSYFPQKSPADAGPCPSRRNVIACVSSW